MVPTGGAERCVAGWLDSKGCTPDRTVRSLNDGRSRLLAEEGVFQFCLAVGGLDFVHGDFDGLDNAAGSLVPVADKAGNSSSFGVILPDEPDLPRYSLAVVTCWKPLPSVFPELGPR